MTKHVVLDCGLLRVAFEWHHDRFRHQVCFGSPGEVQLRLISREGRPEDAWPVSPPLQSLHLETAADGKRTAMLVGMAGTSHWSMSVEADVKEKRLTFDVACRVREAPACLGSSYDFSAESIGGEYRLEIEPEPPLELMGDSNGYALHAPLPAGKKFPTTVRWRYAIRLAEPLRTP